MFKKSAAIAAFENHKSNIDSLQEEGYAIWMFQLVDLVLLYMGPESSQYKGVNSNKESLTGDFTTSGNSYYRFNKNKSISLIDSYIQFINKNGIYKDKKSAQNVLGTLTNEALLAFISVLCSACFFTGLFYGKYEKEISSENKANQVEKADNTPQLQVPNGESQRAKMKNSKPVIEYDSMPYK